MPRPEIYPAPQAVTYGQSFTISSPQANGFLAAGRVTLVRLSSVTHSFNMNQRFLELTPLDGKNGLIYLQAPTNPNLCPPGHYMLFTVDGSGTPSQASIIKIDNNTCPSLSLTSSMPGINPNACDQIVEFTVTGGSLSSTYTWTVNGSAFATPANQTTMQVSASTSAPTVQVSVAVGSAGCGASATVTIYFPGYPQP